MSNKKRILVLGGSPFQIPLIEKAKELGLYVITCDYLPDNPGHGLADEYYNASTTDKEAVLEIAKRCRVDAITTFCSDPAVPSVAYVAEALGLPGPRVSSIEKLTEKDKFRELMYEAGLKVPSCFTVRDGNLPEEIDPQESYIVKPVDSSGSKGITRSLGEPKALRKAIDYALSFSRAGRCIIESFIEGKQVHGDAFVQNGKVVYHYLGDHCFFTGTNSFVPISTRWPASITNAAMASVIEQVERIVQAAGYLDGPINIEARVDSYGVAYIIEVGPRNGGNFVPIIQQRLSGFDFSEAVVNLALGRAVSVLCFSSYRSGAYYIAHVEKKGFFQSIEISNELKKSLFFKRIFKVAGDQVFPFTGSGQTIGVLLFDYSAMQPNDFDAERLQKHVSIKVIADA